MSQELEVERKRLPPLEDRIVHLESDLASQEDAVRYSEQYFWLMVSMCALSYGCMGKFRSVREMS